ncbi:Centromere protein Chl4/mis15/CENP-N [Naviculisporaceae sp. PSN 640]
MSRISIPTKARLPSTLRVDPSHPAVSKVLNRLSRSSLIAVVLDWLKDERIPLSRPYIRQRHEEEEDEDDDDDFYPLAQSVPALRELYQDLQARKGSKREVLDRITEGDWRHGLSLYQLAIADLQYLYDHPTSQKWTAYRIVALKTATKNDENAADDDDPKLDVDKESLTIPRFHPSTFLQSLQETTLPDVKAHYSFDRHQSLPILLLRIFILDSPYNTSLSLQAGGATFDIARTIYIAFPDDSPHIYISKPQTLSSSGPGQNGSAAGGGGESKSLRSLILEGIPKALSRPPHQRYTLKSTNLVTKNLNELLERRGATRTNSAGGGWSIYADESVKESPLDTVLPLSPPLSVTDDDSSSDEDDELPEEKERRKKERAAKRPPMSPASKRDEKALKRARLVAKGRFGDSARVDDGRGVERVDIVIEDAFPSAPAAWDVALATSRKRRRQEEEDIDDGHGNTGRGGKGRKSTTDLTLHGEDDDEGEDQEQEEASGQRKEGEPQWRPNIKITFHGSHVFAGIRQLVERGVIDGERMPGWMTGEEGVTIGVVRNGRIKGHKGGGL